MNPEKIGECQKILTKRCKKGWFLKTRQEQIDGWKGLKSGIDDCGGFNSRRNRRMPEKVEKRVEERRLALSYAP